MSRRSWLHHHQFVVGSDHLTDSSAGLISRARPMMTATAPSIFFFRVLARIDVVLGVEMCDDVGHHPGKHRIPAVVEAARKDQRFEVASSVPTCSGRFAETRPSARFSWPCCWPAAWPRQGSNGNFRHLVRAMRSCARSFSIWSKVDHVAWGGCQPTILRPSGILAVCSSWVASSGA